MCITVLDDESCQYLSLWFKYVIFYIFICIPHLLHVCYRLTMWQCFGLFHTSTSQLLNKLCVKNVMIIHTFISFSAVQKCNLSYNYSIGFLTGILSSELTMWHAPSWLDGSVGRALLQYHRGHGFESHSGFNIFQALISQLLKLCE